EAAQRVAADDLTGLFDGHVVLSDVQPVGTRLARDQRPVVDDQQRAEALAQRVRGDGDGDELFIAEVLLAQLHDVDAPGDRRANHLRQRASPWVGVADEIEPGGGQTRAAGGAEIWRGHLQAVSQARARARWVPRVARPAAIAHRRSGLASAYGQSQRRERRAGDRRRRYRAVAGLASARARYVGEAARARCARLWDLARRRR